MTTTLDRQMEEASQALATMDYLTCESLCEAALAQARMDQDWAYYGRILLPLQECRRQRRMIAAEGVIRLGTAQLGGGPHTWLEHLMCGCLVITRPHTRAEASRLLHEVRERRLHVELLYADGPVHDASWNITTLEGEPVSVSVAAPVARLRDQWLTPQAGDAMPGEAAEAAKWFSEAAEQLGDALLAQVKESDPVRRIAALEACIQAAPDHELLHQALADAAKSARLSGHASATGRR